MKKHWAESKVANAIWWIGDSVVFLVVVTIASYVAYKAVF